LMRNKTQQEYSRMTTPRGLPKRLDKVADIKENPTSNNNT